MKVWITFWSIVVCIMNRFGFKIFNVKYLLIYKPICCHDGQLDRYTDPILIPRPPSLSPEGWGIKSLVMNGVLGHDSALQGYTGPGTTCANEVNFVAILVQDWLLDMLTSSPAHYHCAPDAPLNTLIIHGWVNILHSSTTQALHALCHTYETQKSEASQWPRRLFFSSKMYS